jgi:LysR family transcriptional regulator, glycine cleavage system transcriptional activator
VKSLRASIPSLNALAVFEAAARHCSLTRAAVELNIAQSAVSRHVANLEAQVGTRLFERIGNKLSLTTNGADLADAMSAALGKIRNTVEAIQRRESQECVLTIACTFAMAHDWVMPRFGTIRQLAPDRQVRLLTSDTYIDFDAAEVDMSIRYGNASDWAGLVSRKLFDEHAFPICAPSLLDKFPGLMRDDPEAWTRAPLLHLTPESRGSVDWTDWFDHLGVPPPADGPIFSTYTPLLQEAIAGRGVALGWKEIIDPYIANGQLVRLGRREMMSDKSFYIVHRPDGEDQLLAQLAQALCARPALQNGRPTTA